MLYYCNVFFRRWVVNAGRFGFVDVNFAQALLITDRLDDMASRKILKAIKGARLGDAEAQLELGNCYLEGGEGLAANLLSAYRWLSAAADQGSDKAAWLIGEKVPANAVDSPLRARVYFEKAAQAGSAAAATVLAAWEFAGALGPVGGGPDGSAGGAAIRRLRGAAEKGFLPAQVELGRLATLGRAPVEDLAWLERAAERGDKEAVTVLAGHYYRAGRCDLWRLGQVPGQPEGADGRNAAEQQAARLALQWHEVAWPAPGSAVPAERAYERGCLQLRQHQRAAGPWLESAAEAGHGRAAYLLGLLYLGASYINGLGRDAVPRGRWFPRSYPRAAHWLERAAGGGVAEADLALFVLHGLRGISLRDSGRQETCLVRAAEAGHPQAQFLLAESIWRQAADGLDARLQALRWWQWAAGSACCATPTAARRNWMPGNRRRCGRWRAIACLSQRAWNWPSFLCCACTNACCSICAAPTRETSCVSMSARLTAKPGAAWCASRRPHNATPWSGRGASCWRTVGRCPRTPAATMRPGGAGSSAFVGKSG